MKKFGVGGKKFNLKRSCVDCKYFHVIGHGFHGVPEHWGTPYCIWGHSQKETPSWLHVYKLLNEFYFNCSCWKEKKNK
jgi:hypothetical protein